MQRSRGIISNLFCGPMPNPNAYTSDEAYDKALTAWKICMGFSVGDDSDDDDDLETWDLETPARQLISRLKGAIERYDDGSE